MVTLQNGKKILKIYIWHLKKILKHYVENLCSRPISVLGKAF